METSIEKVGGVENSSKKSKSLDLQSLYKTKDSKKSKDGTDKGKKFAEGSDVEVMKEKKKKKRKSTGSNRKEPEGKKRRKSSDEEGHVNGVRSKLDDVGRSLFSSSQKLNSSSEASINISFIFDQNGKGFQIPKRPRGTVRRKRNVSDFDYIPLVQVGYVDRVGKLKGEVKKGEGDRVSKLSGASGGEIGSGDRVGKVKKGEGDGVSKLSKSSGGETCPSDRSGQLNGEVRKGKGVRGTKFSGSSGGEPGSCDRVGKLNGVFKKGDGDRGLKLSGSSGRETGSSDRVGKLNGDLKKGKGDRKSKLSGSSGGDTGSSDRVGKSNGGINKGDGDRGIKLSGSSGGEAGSSDQVGKLNGELMKGKGDRKSKLSGSFGGETGSSDRVGKLNGGVRKGDGDQGSKLSGSSSGETASGDLVGKLLSSSVGNVASSKVKRKTGINEVKDSGNGSARLAQHATEEDGLCFVNNGNASSRKRRRNHRKRKDLAPGSEAVAEKVEPSAKPGGDDDEENLEENAARMLSSRFDPSCTGFSLSPSTDQHSLMISSGRNLVDQNVNSLAGSESPTIDMSNRLSGPKKKQKSNGTSGKRRNYYEILPRDLNAHWVLDRRIKVFWPLDQSWYCGLVIGYDPEKGLHNVKYDDREEEWVNLQNEKFKLLLLPSEVPGKGELKEPSMKVKAVDKEKINPGMDNDVDTDNCLDSEPIISWLARSRRVKHSPSGPVKKQKISQPLFDRVNDSKGNAGSSGRDGNEIGGDVALPDRSTDGGRGEQSLLESPGTSEVKKLIVYQRKRFRKKGKELSPTSGHDNGCDISRGTLSPPVPAVHRLLIWKECGRSFLGCSDIDKLLWSFDDEGSLSLCMPLIESEGFRFEICLSILPSLGYLLGSEHLWLSYNMMLIQYGSIVARSPAIIFEMLVIDNIVGMRALLFEGSLEQAVAIIFFILSVFNQHTTEKKFIDLELPVTSVRIRLSSVRDPLKQHVFAFYSFCKLKNAKWLYLDSELQRHCSLMQRLPLSECTYDNIKAFKSRSHQLDAPCGGLELSIHERRSVRDVLPICPSGESCSRIMPQSAFNFAIKAGKLPPFAVSFSAAPTFFLGLHLKMLMNRSYACLSLRDVESIASHRDSGNSSQPITQDCSQVQSYSENIIKIVPLGNSLADASSSACLTSVQLQLENDVISVSDVVDNITSSWNLENGNIDVAEASACTKKFENTETEAAFASHRCESDDRQLEQPFSSLQPSLSQTIASPTLSSAKGYSSLDGMSVEIPSPHQVDRSFDGRSHLSGHASELTWDMTTTQSPNSGVPRSSWRRSRSSISSPQGDLSPLWSGGKTNNMPGVFSNGPKKPRTQVQYTTPFGGYNLSSSQRSEKRSLPYKRIRRADNKRTSDSSRSAQRNLELSVCDANVLITVGDRGWREYGARVLLELAEHNEWRLAVKLSGVTKYSYKANNILQPGSTNRYTHAMMWKGGKDWALEFPDRSQWMLFKEMHEECCNRNVRAASVKNIPIPGVRLIEESDNFAANVPYVRHFAKYFRQVENDVDMAMNPSRVLYDMDSEDEQWLSESKQSLCTEKGNCKEISDELFEKTMDMFEKVAYVQQRDHFTSHEIEELMVGVGSTEVANVIYEHWRQKRQRKGMPLMRHLQPPLWEMYQEQVKEWEQAAAKASTAISGGCPKSLATEKPPMFAFCLKPRGLEIPNKGSKQRSQKKLAVAVHNYAVSGDHYGGRRFNGNAFGDEKVVSSGTGFDSPEVSPLLQSSTRVFSPRDARGHGYFSLSNDVSEWNSNGNLRRNKVKRIGGFPSPTNPAMVASLNHQRTISKNNGVNHWSMDVSEWPNQKQYHNEGFSRHNIQHFDGSDLQEFRLRDASGAAQHAQNIAKVKRERAQSLHSRADLAIHKAVVALMTAEAMKAASENSNVNG